MDPDFNPVQGGISITVVKFSTEYRLNPDGSQREVDKVEWAPKGKAKYQTTVEYVSHVEKDRSGKWEAIKPYYEAWKKGQEMPTEGTPLAAWAGILAHQADALRGAQIRTVEDVAGLTDAIMQRIGLPGLRELRATAQTFLKNRNSPMAAINADMALKDEQIALLQQQMADLKELITNPQEAAAAPRRGRPPKTDAPIDHEHAA